eukprot:gene21341-25647_t
MAEDLKGTKQQFVPFMKAAFAANVGDVKKIYDAYLPLVQMSGQRGESRQESDRKVMAQTKFLLALALGRMPGGKRLTFEAFDDLNVKTAIQVPPVLLHHTVALFHSDISHINAASLHLEDELKLNAASLTSILATVKHMHSALGNLPNLMGISPGVAKSLVSITDRKLVPNNPRHFGPLAVLIGMKDLNTMEPLIDVLQGEAVSGLTWHQNWVEAHYLAIADAIVAVAGNTANLMEQHVAALSEILLPFFLTPLPSVDAVNLVSSEGAVSPAELVKDDGDVTLDGAEGATNAKNEERQGPVEEKPSSNKEAPRSAEDERRLQMRLHTWIALMFQLGRRERSAAVRICARMLTLQTPYWDPDRSLGRFFQSEDSGIETMSKSHGRKRLRSDMFVSDGDAMRSRLKSDEFDEDVLGPASAAHAGVSVDSSVVYLEVPMEKELDDYDWMTAKTMLVLEYVLCNSQEFHSSETK